MTDRLTIRMSKSGAEDSNRPCVRVLLPDGTETGIAFHGVPGGHEFTSFVLGLYNAAGPGQALEAEAKEAIDQILSLIHICPSWKAGKTMEKPSNWKEILKNFETYIAAILFAIIAVLLTVQVFSRYVLNHSFAWTEELATLLFVPMIYCGIASAVTKRKHVSIEIVQQLVPFKVRKVLMILSQIIFLVFCVYIQFPLYKVISNLGDSVTDLLRLSLIHIYREIWHQAH